MQGYGLGVLGFPILSGADGIEIAQYRMVAGALTTKIAPGVSLQVLALSGIMNYGSRRLGGVRPLLINFCSKPVEIND
jgi:hypothetical protein